MSDLSDQPRLTPAPAALEDLALAVARNERGLRELMEHIERQQGSMARLHEQFIKTLWPRDHATEKETLL